MHKQFAAAAAAAADAASAREAACGHLRDEAALAALWAASELRGRPRRPGARRAAAAC